MGAGMLERLKRLPEADKEEQESSLRSGGPVGLGN